MTWLTTEMKGTGIPLNVSGMLDVDMEGRESDSYKIET